ncbi:hypothetical protein ACG7TL_003847 [Trametes sanguinea]
MFAHSKPRKSLRQRLDPVQDQDPPPYQSTFAFSESVRVPCGASLRRPDIPPRAQSRSASVMSSAYGRQEDDLSTIMMRGASDLRNAKFEIEEKRREIALLQSQLVTANKEKDEISQRLKAVKEAAQRSLQASCSSLEAMRTSVAELKTQSETSFNTINDARSSLANVRELRADIAASIQNMNSYLEGGEQWAKVKEMKGIIDTLELECSKSQQVADLLRDRLQSVGGELVEAKNRVSELETTQSEDRAALSRANGAIVRSMSEIATLAECVKKQQAELYDTLSIAADFEAKLATAKERINELDTLLEEQNDKLKMTAHLQADVARLQVIVAEKEASVSEFKEIQKQLVEVQSKLDEKDVQISQLTSTGVSNEAHLQCRDARIKQLEEELQNERRELSVLKEQLAASQTREEASKADLASAFDEKAALSSRVDGFERELADVQGELQTRLIKLQETESRYQALEERFEDQAVTLRLTREAAGDAQERLLSSNTAHAKQMAEITGKYEQDNAVLQEQKLGLERTIEVLETAVKRQEVALQALKEEHATHLRELDAAHAARASEQDKHTQQLINELADCRLRINSAEEYASRTEVELREMRSQLTAAQVPSPEVEAELRDLRSQVTALEATDMKKTLRAKTIESRYRTGDLNEEEKIFINSLLRTSQTIHERELVANRNELRRRDNILKEMRAKVHLLETGDLTDEHYYRKVKPVPPIAGNSSLIDPSAWMSSGQSSSPVRPLDGDERPSVDITAQEPPVSTAAVNNTNAGKASTGHASASHDLPSGYSGHIAIAPSHHSKPTPPSGKRASPPTAKPKFGRLATDCSDEILDFDDESAAPKSSPLSLGKRSKPNSPQMPAEAQVVSRPLKRVRTSTARKTVAVERDTSSGTAQKGLKPSASKTKARKRR